MAAKETNDHVLRPKNDERFRTSIGKKILEDVMSECFPGKSGPYSNLNNLTQQIGTITKERLKGSLPNMPNFHTFTHAKIKQIFNIFSPTSPEIQIYSASYRWPPPRTRSQDKWIMPMGFGYGPHDLPPYQKRNVPHDDVFCEAIIFAIFQH
uniref:Gag_pre-integrs domain-containing protein n=1 Tax=Syphacia muris TaxID=451379 RepID=A0A0N5ASF6_9BILA